MKIQGIQNIAAYPRYSYSTGITAVRNAAGMNYGIDSYEINTPLKRTQKTPAFTGSSRFAKRLFAKYIERKSYKTSIFGSKRPYFSIADDLKPVLKEIKIDVSPLEKINALDINRGNSKDYVIFLHGFSQNIHDNQPLYREISKTKFGILVPEYRGYGQNPPTVNYQEKDIMQDIISSVKYLENKGCKCRGIIGHSFGAYAGAGVSKKTNPDFLIMVSPMLSMEFWLKNVIKHPKKYKFEYKLIRYIKHFKEQYSKVFDITRHFQNNNTPTYIIQANNDSYVRTCKVNALAKKIPNLKQYRKINSGGHRMCDNKISEIKSILDNLA